jgi:hypothetical protein
LRLPLQHHKLPLSTGYTLNPSFPFPHIFLTMAIVSAVKQACVPDRLLRV